MGKDPFYGGSPREFEKLNAISREGTKGLSFSSHAMKRLSHHFTAITRPFISDILAKDINEADQLLLNFVDPQP